MKTKYACCFLLFMINSLIGFARPIVAEHDTVKPLSRPHTIALAPFQVLMYKDRFLPGSKLLAAGLFFERTIRQGRGGVCMHFGKFINRRGFFVLPSVKYYTKSRSGLTYGAGPQLLLSFLEDYMPDYLGGPGYSGTRVQMGIALGNQLRFAFSNKVSIGADGGLGFLFYDGFYFGQEASQHIKFTDLLFRQTFNFSLNIAYHF